MAAPCGERDERPACIAEILARAERLSQSSPARGPRSRGVPWSSSQAWRRSTSRSASGQAGPSVLVRKVGVDPVGGLLRLVDDDRRRARRGRRSPQPRTTRYTTATAEAARHAPRRSPRTSGLSRNAIIGRGQEEEERVTQRARQRPREHGEHRQADELDPAWDLDRGAGSGIADRTAVVAARRGGVARRLVPVDGRSRSTRTCSGRSPGGKRPTTSATVPRMASPRHRAVARVRARHRTKEHRAGRLLVLGICRPPWSSCSWSPPSAAAPTTAHSSCRRRRHRRCPGSPARSSSRRQARSTSSSPSRRAC